MSYRSSLLACFASIAVISIGCGDGSNGTGTAGSSAGSSGGTAAAGRGGDGGSAAGSGGSTGVAGTGGGAAGTSAAGSGGSGTAGTGGGAAGTGGSSAGTGGGSAGRGGAGGGNAGTGGGAAGTGGGSAGRGGAGGGAAGTGGGSAGQGGGGGGTSAFTLTSTTFQNGAMIPVNSTCATTMTSSRMPQMMWTGAPAGTMSFAIVFVDTTMLPAATGFHSAIWDIPGNVSMLQEGLPAGSPPAGIAGLESAKQKKPSGMAYLGPCPNFGMPAGTGPVTDDYAFRLYAFSAATLPAAVANGSIQQTIMMIESQPRLGMAVLTGRSNAAGTSLK